MGGGDYFVAKTNLMLLMRLFMSVSTTSVSFIILVLPSIRGIGLSCCFLLIARMCLRSLEF